MKIRTGGAAVALLASACSSTSAQAPAVVPDDASSVILIVDATTAIVDAASDVPLPNPDVTLPAPPCNGDPTFCARTYDSLSYPAAHAAMAVGDPPFACPAQDQSVRSQVDHGIRALDLEAHAAAGDASPQPDAGGALVLCLGSCDRGAAPMAGALADVRSFLDVNPREIVTLIVEGGVDAAALASEMAAAGLDTLAWSHAHGTPWPTLEQMVEQGQRVMLLADTTGAAPGWMLPLWTEVAETGRSFPSTAAMTCDVARGAPDAPLFLLNETLVAAGADATTGPDAATEAGAATDAGAAGCSSPALAHEANGEPFFLDRAKACQTIRGRRPTFVAVDDYDDGDVFGVTRALDLMP